MILLTSDLTTWLIPLVIVHLLPFVLIPLVMLVFARQKLYYEPKINSYLMIQLGFICLFISMIIGFYSHVAITNFGYKTNKFNILDVLVFVLMTTCFCLVSYGLKKGGYEDLIMLAAIISIPLGYAAQIEPMRYMGQTIGLIFMTIRSYQVLKDKRIILFPLFSLVLNVTFLLLEVQTHHPVFHLLHDVAGTLLGFAIFGILFDLNGNKPPLTKLLIENVKGIYQKK